MTRFGDISQFWPNLKSLGQFLRVYLLLGKNLDQLWQILYAIGQVFIDVNGQILKNNLAIWSHWSCSVRVGEKNSTLFGFKGFLRHQNRANVTQENSKTRAKDKCGLVVMRGDWRARGHEFEPPRHRVLVRSLFLTYLFEKTKNK